MSERRMIDILVNQVGYDIKGSKRFIVQSGPVLERSEGMDLSHHNGTYVLKEKDTNTAVYHGDLTYFGKVYEGTPNDWGFWYWTGDFSDLQRTGEYVIEVEIGSAKGMSYPFTVGVDLLWQRTAPVALSYYADSHNTRENHKNPQRWKPNGILEEDGKYYDVNGAWFEFGKYGGTFMRDAAKIVWSLLLAYERDSTNSMILDELRWGGEWWKKIMIHYPQSGRIVSGMGGWHKDNGKIAWHDYPYGHHQHFKFISLLIYARLYAIFGDEEYLKRGELMWDYYHDWVETDKVFSTYYLTGGTQEKAGIAYNASWKEPGYNYTRVDDAAMLFGDVELYRVTRDEKYLRHAERMVDNITSEITDEDSYFKYWNNNYTHLHPSALAYFADKFPKHAKTPLLKAKLEAFLDLMIADSQASPFGIARKNFIYFLGWNPESVSLDTSRTFFNHSEEGKGTNPEMGLEAWQALLINKVIPKDEYVAFARNHLNWILGINPRNFCMMKGVGSNVPEMYPGGDLDGCICHGIIADHEFDRPWLGRWSSNLDMASGLDWVQDNIAGYKIWAQPEAITRGTAGYMMALALLPRRTCSLLVQNLVERAACSFRTPVNCSAPKNKLAACSTSAISEKLV